MQPNTQLKANAKCSYLVDDFTTHSLVTFIYRCNKELKKRKTKKEKTKQNHRALWCQTPGKRLHVICRGIKQLQWRFRLLCSETNSKVNMELSDWNSILPYQQAVTVDWRQLSWLPPHGDADGIIIFKFLCSFSCFSILKATMSSTEKRQQSSCQSTKCNTGYHFFKAECVRARL